MKSGRKHLLSASLVTAAALVSTAVGCSASPSDESSAESSGAVVTCGAISCAAGELCVAGVCTKWDCRLTRPTYDWVKDAWVDVTVAAPKPQDSIGNTDAACRTFCDSKFPEAGDACRHNGVAVKDYRCTISWENGAYDNAFGGVGDGDASCIEYCQEARRLNSGLPNATCRRNGVLLMAKGETDFQPPAAGSGDLIDDDTGDVQPDGSQPVRLWDCAPAQRTATSTFGSCANGTVPLTAAAVNLMHQKARAYLAYITGGASVPVALQGPYWSNASRLTGRRLAWLRQAFLEGKVRGRFFKNVNICSKSTSLYRMEGSLAGIDVAACGAACGGVAPAHRNPAEHVAIINRTIRFEAGACATNDPIPTFFHASHYRVVGDSSFLIDPEPAALVDAWPSSAATAAATGIHSSATLTAYRHGSANPAKAGRVAWIGAPCLVGTSSPAAGTKLTQVWFPVPTNANYLTCAPCGSSGQACCPNADFATSGKSTTCDNNGGLGCNTSTGKCN